MKHAQIQAGNEFEMWYNVGNFGKFRPPVELFRIFLYSVEIFNIGG